MYTVAIGIVTIAYTFFLFPRMTKQYGSDLSEQFNSSQLQVPMIMTLVVIMMCMLLDRIFYNIQATIAKEAMSQRLNFEKIQKPELKRSRS